MQLLVILSKTQDSSLKVINEHALELTEFKLLQGIPLRLFSVNLSQTPPMNLHASIYIFKHAS